MMPSATSAPRNFAYKTDIFPLVVCDMKEIGQADMTEDMVDKIKRLISECEDKESLRHDYNIAPGWIRKILSI